MFIALDQILESIDTNISLGEPFRSQWLVNNATKYPYTEHEQESNFFATVVCLN